MTMPSSFLIETESGAVPVRVCPHPQARRLRLRIRYGEQEARLTVPIYGVREAQISAFLEKQKDWLTRHFFKKCGDLAHETDFRIGATLPLYGAPHLIIEGSRRRVLRQDGQIQVAGDPAGIRQRLYNWLRREAYETIQPLAESKAVRIERRIKRIAIRDTSSRWGSASGLSNLNFSWRLICTPPVVLDYVVAHEVAHLRHMNHGADFWDLCADLSEDMQAGKIWLKRHGDEIMAIRV